MAQRGNSGWNIDPPNRADLLGPVVPANQWWSGTIDGRGGAFPVPFAYQAHKARYVDPNSGAESRIIIVPMCDLLSYQNGFGTMGTGDIDAHIAPFNNPAQPSLVLMAHDGDNAWGGGYSYYQESVPNFANAAAGRSYRPTTIEQFLADHPAPESNVVHVEDGAWVNAANDWGHPQFINWLWPPTRRSSDPLYSSTDPRTWFDIEAGWTEDWRNWAVIVAGANFCETAEQIALTNGGSVLAWKIQEPTQKNGVNNNPNSAEQAWHYFLGALDSGFMYYGTSLDDEVKQTLACNRAIAHATNVIGNAALDRTPPTVFKPQRFPWNPGGMGWGPLTGYQPVGFSGKPPYSSDFYLWTHVFDVSGVTNVTLNLRTDGDGVNTLLNDENETFAGGPGVSAWLAIGMNRRVIPKTNVTGNANIDFFLLPTAIADHYWVKVIGYRNQLLDYYISATDSKGNTTRSDIQHVWVADDLATNAPTTNLPPFVIDGILDFTNYLQSAAGLTLYAAMRGTTLYLATRSPGNNNAGPNDHFLFVTDELAPPTNAAQWAKSGVTVFPVSHKPYIGSEQGNTFVGWYNAPASSTAAKAVTTNGYLEGRIDLFAEFGSIPPVLYVAAAAYATANGGGLVAQSPAGSGLNMDTNEFLAIATAALLDNNGDGIYDRLDPQLDFKITSTRLAAGRAFSFDWASVPGRSYQVWQRPSLDASWQPAGGVLLVAPLQTTLSFTNLAPTGQAFYQVQLNP